MNKRRLLVVLALSALSVGIADQVLARVFMDEGQLFGHRVAPFEPPVFSAGQELEFAKLEKFVETGVAVGVGSLFDADLGWCPPRGRSFLGMNFDKRGARVGPEPVAEARTEGVRRVLAMGCSFTLGHEVEDAETWPYLLDASSASLEVINLGANAYGLDQAWLRYQRDGRSGHADEVWLGWLPSVSLRVGSMYRPAMRHWSGPLLFKPRFRLHEGALQLVENPAKSRVDVHRLITSQADFLDAVGDDDIWVRRARAAYAPMGDSWLHHSGLGRLWLTYAERGAREPALWLEDESSEVRRLVFEIVAGFRADVESAGARFRLVILPGIDDLTFQRDHGRGYWVDLADDLRAAGVEVVDLTEACLDAGMLDDPDAWQPGTHYAPKSNEVIAAALKRILEE
jgi:hypothetical protein